MKTKKCFMFIIVFISILFCTACKGNVTRALRHDGFNYGDEFVCDAFYPKNKDDTSYEKIKYLTTTHIITDQGRIYEISLDRSYSNDTNCRVADTNLEVVSIFDESIIKASDGKLYYLSSDKATPYTEVTSQDNSYELYSLLLSQLGVTKVTTVDSSSGTYYALNANGNVYIYNVSKKDRNSPLQVTGSSIVYRSADYGGNIIDYNYAGNSGSTFIRTNDKVYKMTAENGTECTKYADVECNFVIKESEAYTKYKDYFLGYNGYMVITTYGRVFTASN